MTPSTAINKLLKIARGELGYLEKASNSQLDDKTANAGSANYTKYWRDIKPEYQGQPWCACYVTWLFTKAFGKDKAEKLLKHYPYVYCPTMASLFTLNANPKVGDIVIFKHNGVFTHTGIVTGVNGDYFTTNEGNTSGGHTIVANGGGVCAKGYYNSNLPGTKFCTPDWSLLKDDFNEDEEELTMAQYNELKKMIEDQNARIQTLETENSILKQAIGWDSNSNDPALYSYNDSNLGKIAVDANEVIGRLISEGKLSIDEKNGFAPLSKTAIRLLIIQNRK